MNKSTMRVVSVGVVLGVSMLEMMMDISCDETGKEMSNGTDGTGIMSMMPKASTLASVASAVAVAAVGSSLLSSIGGASANPTDTIKDIMSVHPELPAVSDEIQQYFSETFKTGENSPADSAIGSNANATAETISEFEVESEGSEKWLEQGLKKEEKKRIIDNAIAQLSKTDTAENQKRVAKVRRSVEAALKEKCDALIDKAFAGIADPIINAMKIQYNHIIVDIPRATLLDGDLQNFEEQGCTKFGLKSSIEYQVARGTNVKVYNIDDDSVLLNWRERYEAQPATVTSYNRLPKADQCANLKTDIIRKFGRLLEVTLQNSQELKAYGSSGEWIKSQLEQLETAGCDNNILTFKEEKNIHRFEVEYTFEIKNSNIVSEWAGDLPEMEAMPTQRTYPENPIVIKARKIMASVCGGDSSVATTDVEISSMTKQEKCETLKDSLLSSFATEILGKYFSPDQKFVQIPESKADNFEKHSNCMTALGCENPLKYKKDKEIGGETHKVYNIVDENVITMWIEGPSVVEPTTKRTPTLAEYDADITLAKFIVRDVCGINPRSKPITEPDAGNNLRRRRTIDSTNTGNVDSTLLHEMESQGKISEILSRKARSVIEVKTLEELQDVDYESLAKGVQCDIVGVAIVKEFKNEITQKINGMTPNVRIPLWRADYLQRHCNCIKELNCNVSPLEFIQTSQIDGEDFAEYSINNSLFVNQILDGTHYSVAELPDETEISANSPVSTESDSADSDGKRTKKCDITLKRLLKSTVNIIDDDASDGDTISIAKKKQEKIKNLTRILERKCTNNPFENYDKRGKTTKDGSMTLRIKDADVFKQYKDAQSQS